MKHASHEHGFLRYRPSATRVVERWVTGVSSQPSEISTGIGSLSIQAYDRRVLIRQPHNMIDHQAMKDIELAFSSQSYIQIEPGKKYLFAINQEDCLGFLEVVDPDHLRLPDGTIEALDTYIDKRQNLPFPDYYGALDQD